MHFSHIAGTGAYNPSYLTLTNKDLEKMVETSDDWIVKRTGIRTRHIGRPDETNATMGYEAGKKACEDASTKPEDVELIIVATNTNERPIPACGAEIQHRLGAKCGFFDIQAGCSAFSYALAAADSFVRAGLYKTILTVGTDKLSSITNWKERETCVLFGDMASAAVVKRSKTPGLLNHYLGGDGSMRDAIGVTFPDIERLVARKEGVRNYVNTVDGPKEINTTGHGYLTMKGTEVFKWARDAIPEAIMNVLKPNDYMKQGILDPDGTPGFTLDDVDCIIPHNANSRIIEAAAEKLAMKVGMPADKVFKKFYFTIEQYGNTSTASYPNSYHMARKKGLIKPGNLVMLVGFGAGVTIGANLMYETSGSS